MPFIKVNTNVNIKGKEDELLSSFSKMSSQALAKPESYIMLELNGNKDMMFAGDNEPLAYVECKSIGLDEYATKELSDKICSLINDKLGVRPARIYIEFSNAQRHMWGFNKSTF